MNIDDAADYLLRAGQDCCATDTGFLVLVFGGTVKRLGLRGTLDPDKYACEASMNPLSERGSLP